MAQVEWIAKVIENLPGSTNNGEAYQADAATTVHSTDRPVIVTDPPYYDNIGYADLSDFFYVWLRSILRNTYPELFGGMTTPKDEEMIVNKSRFEDSHIRFEALMQKALARARQHCSNGFSYIHFFTLTSSRR